MFKYVSKLFTDYSAKALFMLFCEKMLLPVGMPIMTVILGYINELPLFYIWIGFLASLAFVFHWLIKVKEWRYKTTVKGKLNFTGLHPFIDSNKKYGVQIQFDSIAEFPIDCRVTKLDLKLADRVPLAGNSIASLTIPAHGYGWRNSGVVVVDSTVSNITKGTLEYEISYGKGKTYNEVINGVLNIDFIFDELGGFQVFWSEGGANEQGHG